MNHRPAITRRRLLTAGTVGAAAAATAIPRAAVADTPNAPNAADAGYVYFDTFFAARPSTRRSRR